MKTRLLRKLRKIAYDTYGIGVKCHLPNNEPVYIVGLRYIGGGVSASYETEYASLDTAIRVLADRRRILIAHLVEDYKVNKITHSLKIDKL